MPRTVKGPGGQITFDNHQWGMVMKASYSWGWKPQGTLAPAGWSDKPGPDGAPRKWFKNNYFSRAGQVVTDEDASAIARAIENALPDVPDHDAMLHKVGSFIDFPDNRQLRSLRPGSRFNAYEYFSGANKRLLRQFMELCRAGGFVIV